MTQEAIHSLTPGRANNSNRRPLVNKVRSWLLYYTTVDVISLRLYLPMDSLKKRRLQKVDVVKHLVFAEGIPPLRRIISETGPSVPTEEDHPAVSFEERDFGLLTQEIF